MPLNDHVALVSDSPGRHARQPVAALWRSSRLALRQGGVRPLLRLIEHAVEQVCHAALLGAVRQVAAAESASLYAADGDDIAPLAV